MTMYFGKMYIPLSFTLYGKLQNTLFGLHGVILLFSKNHTLVHVLRKSSFPLDILALGGIIKEYHYKKGPLMNR